MFKAGLLVIDYKMTGWIRLGTENFEQLKKVS